MGNFFSHFDSCIHSLPWYSSCAKTTLLNCSNERIKKIQKGIWLNTWCGGSTVWYIVDLLSTSFYRTIYELAKDHFSILKKNPDILSTYKVPIIVGSVGTAFLCYRWLFSHPPSMYKEPEYESCRKRICRITGTPFKEFTKGSLIFAASSLLSIVALAQVPKNGYPSVYLTCAGIFWGVLIKNNELTIFKRKQELKKRKEEYRIDLVKKFEKIFKGEIELQVSHGLTLLPREKRKLLDRKIKELPDDRERSYLMGEAYKFGISGITNDPKAIEFYKKAYKLGKRKAGNELWYAYTHGKLGVRPDLVKAEKYAKAYMEK